MAYQVLALKYRPQRFEEIVAQEHISTTLKNALKTNKVAQAYLFAGPRGTGKTTTARILAKALNCENGPTVEPCNKCASCNEITSGRGLDVLEIDAASNRGIDDIRQLKEKVGYAAARGKYRVVIVDEVHMLTGEAFNAFLKTLEEPPPHIVFVCATTEPFKVPPTILSRCQRFNFKRIQVNKLVESINSVAEKEQINIDEQAAYLLAKKADGSLRDGLSLLDQVIAFGGNKVTKKLIEETLGLVDREILFELTKIVKSGDAQKGLDLLKELIYSGMDIGNFVEDLLEHFRNLLLAKVENLSPEIFELPAEYIDRYKSETGNFSENDIFRMIKIITDLKSSLKVTDPKLALEMAILRLIKMDSSVTIEEVLKALGKSGSGNPGHNSITSVKPPVPSTDSKVEKPPNKKISFHPPEPVVMGSELLEKWSLLVGGFKEDRPGLSSCLAEAVPYDLQESILTVEFFNGRKFHKQQVEKRENVKLIEGELLKIFGKALKVKFVLDESKKSSPPKVLPDKVKEKKDLSQLARENPVVKDLLENFEVEPL